MSIFEHNRSRIYNPAQHPLVHDISAFGYVNNRLPGISVLSDAIDYIVAVLYPDYIGTYANAAALPVSASANQYAIVSDDGSGHAAGYVWSVIDNTGQWIKRYDMAWSMDAILSETVNRTQYMYVQKYGVDDKDASGTTIAGLYAGQRVFGGATSGNNLTLSANAGNANSTTHSGFVQIDDQFRPTIDNTFSAGSSSFRWSDFHSVIGTIGTLAITSGSLIDSSGAITFGANNLLTTGTLGAGVATLASGSKMGNLTFSNGSITSASGAISFGSNNLSTTGTLGAGVATLASSSKLANITFTNGQIVSASGAISFSTGNLTTTGTLSSGALTATSGTIGTIGLNGDTISTTNLNADLVLTPNGSGKVHITSAFQVDGNGNYPTGSLTVGNLTVATTGISSSAALSISGLSLTIGNTLLPSTDAAKDLGSGTSRFHNIFLSNTLGDGTNTILITDLLKMRNLAYRDTAHTLPAQSGDGLFWDSTSGTWLAASPDNEVVHNLIGGLTTGDAGHTQFVMLSGRAGGQTVQGGTAASDNLYLESTSNVTKGTIFLKNNLKPNTGATYSAGWSGTDLGDATFPFRDIYTRGQHFNFRAENVTSAALPASSAQNVGRIAWATDNNKLYIDNGSAWQVAGVGRYVVDQTFDGTTTSYTITATGIQDARNAIWQLCDNANNFERIFCSIKAISATQVQITANPALPAGSYRLIGLE